MPTASVQPPPNTQYNSGFTLLEIMVVIALIAFISTTIILTIPSKDSIANSNTSQSLQLATTLKRLSQKAVLEQRWHGLYLTQTSYQAVVFKKDKWVIAPNSTSKKTLGGNTLTLLIDNQLQALTAQQQTTSTSDHSYKAHIRIAPSGLFSRFEIHFSDADGKNIVLSDPYAVI
jgi:prepilin-type N-terminal cleavage/methylation domain-containing protein